MLRVWWLVTRQTVRGVKCVLTRDGEVLLVRHTYGRRGRWELPGGGVKRGEQPLDAAIREIREELGVEVRDWTPHGDLFERIDGKRDRLWCFSAELPDAELSLDRAELSEADWFPRGGLPDERAKYVERIVAVAAAPAAVSGPRPAATGARRLGWLRGRG